MTTQLALDGPEYRCLLMDPPWRERGEARKERRRARRLARKAVEGET